MHALGPDVITLLMLEPSACLCIGNSGSRRLRLPACTVLLVAQAARMRPLPLPLHACVRAPTQHIAVACKMEFRSCLAQALPAFVTGADRPFKRLCTGVTLSPSEAAKPGVVDKKGYIPQSHTTNSHVAYFAGRPKSPRFNYGPPALLMAPEFGLVYDTVYGGPSVWPYGAFQV